MIMTEQNNNLQTVQPTKPKKKSPFFYIDRGYLQYLHFFDTSVPYSNYTDDMRAKKFYCEPVNINGTYYFAPVSHQNKSKHQLTIYEIDGRMSYTRKIGISLDTTNGYTGSIDCRHMIPCNDKRFIKQCPIKTKAQLYAARSFSKNGPIDSYAKRMYTIANDKTGIYKNMKNIIFFNKAKKHGDDYIAKVDAVEKVLGEQLSADAKTSKIVELMKTLETEDEKIRFEENSIHNIDKHPHLYETAKNNADLIKTAIENNKTAANIVEIAASNGTKEELSRRFDWALRNMPPDTPDYDDDSQFSL